MNIIETEIMDAAEQPKLKDPPQQPDALAKKWNVRVASAKRHWDRFYRRVRHNRKLAAGFDWTKDPDSTDFYTLRANLIYGAISSFVPAIYARNPEISAVPKHQGKQLKLFCKTLSTVVNRALGDAGIKSRAKATVMSALVCSYGIMKVMYQRDIYEDPHIKSRIEDTQDNIVRVEALVRELNDEQQRSSQARVKAELEQTLAALHEKAEIPVGEGMVIDRVLTENLVIDPAIAEFHDYPQADWMAQIIPMKRAFAEGLYGIRLSGAKKYRANDRGVNSVLSGQSDESGDDEQVSILEIWDKQSQRVYTMAEGCNFWLRAPYSPKTGERWYPFFLLPFNTVDGGFIAPSLVDLTERLQAEHNEARDQYNRHRDLVRPGYLASSDINSRTLKNMTDSVIGEIVLIDTEGKPLNQMIMPKQHPPFDPMAYDVAPVRVDWEMTTGQQDAARSTVVKPKTATEAQIMQQSLSSRISSFRDQVEDYLQEVAKYTAEILLQEYTPDKIAAIMGPHREGALPGVVDPMTGQPVTGIVEHAWDWPLLNREQIFDRVDIQIRAGTTGEPDRIEQQENWGRILPIIQQLVGQIMQLQAQGMDAAPVKALLRETVARFDDRLDPEELMPKAPAQSAMMQDGGIPDFMAAVQNQQPDGGVA